MNNTQSIAVCLAAVLAAAAVACSDSPSAPTPPGRSSDPPSAPIAVEMRGRVVDDLDKPIAGVGVTLDPSRAPDPSKPGGDTTDANGLFTFSALVRTDLGSLNEVPIEIGRDGYEGAGVWIPPNSDTTITMYPTTTIRAGETLQTRIVARAPYACGDESIWCRRVVVEPSAESVEVEVLQTDGEEVGLVDGDPPLTPFDYERRVTVTDGEVFIIGGPAVVTLRAQRR